MTERYSCPFCGSIRTYRSHRRPLEYLLVIFKPFRCHTCNHRFYHFQGPRAQRQARNPE